MEDGSNKTSPDKFSPEKPSMDLVRKSYSDDEISSIYELGKFFLENGSIKQAEIILQGVVEVAPDYAPGWLGLCCIHFQDKNYDSAVYCARQACRVEPELPEALLFLSTCLLNNGDINSAGTYLGEVSDKIDAGMIDNQNLIRFFRAMLARFETR